MSQRPISEEPISRFLKTCLALALSLLLTAPPAGACCDDFWSCAAAVATGGTSCVIENFVKALDNLIHTIADLERSLRAKGLEVAGASRDEIDQHVDRAKQALDEERARLEEAVRKAHEMATRSRQVLSSHSVFQQGAPARPGGGVALTVPGAPAGAAIAVKTPTPVSVGAVSSPGAKHSGPPESVAFQAADPVQMREAMERAESVLQEGKTEILDRARVPEEALRSQAAARAAARDHISLALAIVESRLVQPLNLLANMLGELAKHPWQAFDPGSLVDDQVKAVRADVDAAMGDVYDEVTRKATELLGWAEVQYRKLQIATASFEEVAAAMEKLDHDKSKIALDALNKLVPPDLQPAGLLVRVSPNAELTRVKPRAVLDTGLAKTNLGKIRATTVASSINGDLSSKWASIKSLRTVRPFVDPSMKTRVSQDFDAFFKGKNRADAETKKSELLTEARRRFASDPATLQKVEALIQQEASLRSR